MSRVHFSLTKSNAIVSIRPSIVVYFEYLNLVSLIVYTILPIILAVFIALVSVLRPKISSIASMKILRGYHCQELSVNLDSVIYHPQSRLLLLNAV